MSTQTDSPGLRGVLLELTVRLDGYDFGAQFVNPLSLYWNGVVDDTWHCEPGAQIGVTESNFTYTNGVHIEATSDELLFKSRASSPRGPALAPELAQKYVESFGADHWIGVSLEFLIRVREFVEPPDTPAR